jgi:serine protease Do
MAIGAFPSTAEISNDAATIAERLLASVVLVESRGGSGSGIIWERDGLIVSNSHVVRGDRARVTLRDGTHYEGTLVARDERHDLAALRIEARDLPAVTVGDSSHMYVGQVVLAVGNPMGMRGVVTAGIVTGAGQVIIDGQARLRDMIQADVALAPGNSGGPLVDAAGRVLGVNAMIGPNGIALAIPSATVQAFLLPVGSRRPFLGVTTLTVQTRADNETRGALLVTAVEEGSPAERAGVMQGDIILQFDGHVVESDDALRSILARWDGIAAVHLNVRRGTEARAFTFVPTMQTTGR